MSGMYADLMLASSDGLDAEQGYRDSLLRRGPWHMTEYANFCLGFSVCAGRPIPSDRRWRSATNQREVIFGKTVLHLQFRRRATRSMAQTEQYESTHTHVQTRQHVYARRAQLVSHCIAQ